MLLVDTSVWIELFRKPARLSLAAVGDLDEIATCLPVVQEVLQGFREEAAFRKAREAMLSFPIVESPMPVAVFEEAVELYRAARRAGFTPRSGVDCLIAACARRNGMPVVHVDRDYRLLARVSSLEERSLTV